MTKSDSSGTTQYAWDAENRLKSVTLPSGGGVVNFKCDPFGRRIQKSSAVGTTIYTYDGANIVGEYNATGALVAKYAQGTGIDEPLAMWRNGATAYYNADDLGSTTSLRDAGGASVATYTYDSFGRNVASTATTVNPFLYTGREWDSKTGLYYYRARYYDPQIGRFISEDPIRFSSGDTNFFAYVSNGSPNLVDPSGLIEGSPANSARRTAIADAARRHAGSHDWDVAANKGSQYPRNSWKCSKFVCDVIAEAGAPIHVTVDGKVRCPTAGELANPKWTAGRISTRIRSTIQ